MCAVSNNRITNRIELIHLFLFQGDAAGPLQIYHSSFKCMFDLIGIISFGFPKCGDGPGVYTRVFHYY